MSQSKMDKILETFSKFFWNAPSNRDINVSNACVSQVIPIQKFTTPPIDPDLQGQAAKLFNETSANEEAKKSDKDSKNFNHKKICYVKNDTF
jgi:hypothetical protein